MSRHEIKAIHPNHKVFVGWDHPLLTYFLQVYDSTKEEDENPVVWKGTNSREIYEVGDLQRIAGTYAQFSAKECSTLYNDKDEGR